MKGRDIVTAQINGSQAMAQISTGWAGGIQVEPIGNCTRRPRAVWDGSATWHSLDEIADADRPCRMIMAQSWSSAQTTPALLTVRYAIKRSRLAQKAKPGTFWMKLQTQIF